MSMYHMSKLERFRKIYYPNRQPAGLSEWTITLQVDARVARVVGGLRKVIPRVRQGKVSKTNYKLQTYSSVKPTI